MRILYAIQGTGNGHLTAALEALPCLMKKGQVDILISGTEVDLQLPYEVKYRLHGLCFVFGKSGGIDYAETFRKAKLKRFFKEITSLPIEDYDLVFSDFEPVSAWACKLKNKACIGFSHQAAVSDKGSPKPKKADLLGKAVLKYYAPVTVAYGFHFLPYNTNIYTPIIRKAIRQAEPRNNEHYTVYLPSYSDKRIIKTLSRFPDLRWDVFSKRCVEGYRVENIHIRPLSNNGFVKSLLTAKGVLCNAGFQTPSEALFLKKKLLVIPMKGQYEQQCNAAALAALGVPVLKSLKPKDYGKLKAWMEAYDPVNVHFPDDTEWIIEEIVAQQSNLQPMPLPSKEVTTSKSFRNLLLKKIAHPSQS